MSSRVAFLVLTTRCNRRCSYCFYETGYQSRKDPSTVLAVDEPLLDALEGAEIDKLIFTGGDPLLLPDLAETVRRSTQRGFGTLLLTNGDLLTASLLNQLVEAGLGGLSISLDDMAGVEESKAPWEVMERISADPRINAAVITPITRLNLRLLTEIVRRVSDLALFLLLQPVFIPETSPLYPKLSLGACTPEELAWLEEGIRSWVSRFGQNRYADLLTAYYTGSGARPPYCLMGTDSIVIDSSGDVVPCFHRNDLKTGNILADPGSSLLLKAFEKGSLLRSAPCFGEHCISLFSHL